ncbi:hypothetical protein ACFQ6Q_14785 [Streptomyces sp. NPDC056437]|uniref:hypothetical protein n=1 Tax=Streptomyces sp. NPDC056437 TaxID=3345816 RepID=UPI0036960DEA
MNSTHARISGGWVGVETMVVRALFDGSPSPDLGSGAANMLRIRLFAWWETKGSERQIAKLGERLD